MSNLIENNPSNPLRDKLYLLAKQEIPEYVFQWFFKYFAKGAEFFTSEPLDLLENYNSLFTTGLIMLDHKYKNGIYSKIVKDENTPDWTYYYVGDTHGSFIDTYIIIDYLIKVIQINPNIKIIWLGDYVDRNPFDLQNLAFIISFWLLFPDNVFLLRGNHEDSSVCSRYGFSQHLFEKAGTKEYFSPIWDQVNELFSKLPLGIKSKVGNKRILALHGGIPFDLNNYSPINLDQIEPKLNNEHIEHYDMDTLSQTILWSDPDPFNLSEGVAATPRTGRPRFSKKAFTQFMELNNYDILIRGHEKFFEGYNLLWENRLISLFSTSTYDGKNIGRSKFLRLRPETNKNDIGNEETGQGLGILSVDEKFLEQQLNYYYNAKSSY